MSHCQFCNKILTNNPQSVSNHQRWCVNNPNKISFRADRIASNQYLKAQQNGNDYRLSDMAREKLSQLGKLKRHSLQSKANLSRIAKARGLGGVAQSKRIFYNGYWLGSSYELILAKDLDLNSVEWVVPKKLTYIDNNSKQRTYTADFFLPKYNVYLDPKNDFLLENNNPALGFSDIEKIKWVETQNNVTVFILNKTQLSWSNIKKRLQSINGDALVL